MKSQISLLKFSKPWSTEKIISTDISIVVVRSVIKALELDEDVVIHLDRQQTFSPLINKISVMKVLKDQPQTRLRGFWELIDNFSKQTFLKELIQCHGSDSFYQNYGPNKNHFGK
jgi:hypothetical protein